MSRDRDVAAFGRRAQRYEAGWLGRVHRDIAERTIDVALRGPVPPPRRVLDVGCGPGYLLRRLASLLPEAVALVGVDASPEVVDVARAAADDERLRFSQAAAERLPFADGSFDLVVSTTSFDHWRDQQAGLGECARLLTVGGRLVVTDLFSLLLAPTLYTTHRGKARTKRRADRLLAAAGLRTIEWRDLYAVIIKTVVATK